MSHHIPKVITFSGVAIALLFIILASLWYKGEHRAQVVTSSNTVVQSSESSTESFHQKTATYTIDVEYPSIIDGGKRNSVVHNYFSQMYASSSDQFVKEIKEALLDTSLPEEFKKGVNSHYTVSTDVIATSSRYISFLVTTERYSIGAAHPSHMLATFIFDKKKKELISVNDLFNSPTYVDVVAKASVAYFEGKNKTAGADDFKIDTSSQNDGFLPTEENFSKILPTEKGLMIYFDEYQIAPYVAGPQEALIPYRAVESVINKDGVVGSVH